MDLDLNAGIETRSNNHSNNILGIELPKWSYAQQDHSPVLWDLIQCCVVSSFIFKGPGSLTSQDCERM